MVHLVSQNNKLRQFNMTTSLKWTDQGVQLSYLCRYACTWSTDRQSTGSSSEWQIMDQHLPGHRTSAGSLPIGRLVENIWAHGSHASQSSVDGGRKRLPERQAKPSWVLDQDRYRSIGIQMMRSWAARVSDGRYRWASAALARTWACPLELDRALSKFFATLNVQEIRIYTYWAVEIWGPLKFGGPVRSSTSNMPIDGPATQD
jgi:hypothetical protein